MDVHTITILVRYLVAVQLMLNNQIWNVNKSHFNARPIILIALILENAKIMKRNNNVHVLI